MLRSKTYLFIVVVVLAGALTFFFLLLSLTKKTPPPKAAKITPTSHILIAKRHLNVGVRLKPTDVDWSEIQKKELKPEHIVKKKQALTDYNNLVVRRPIAKNQAITKNRIAYLGHNGYLAALIKPGMRAVSLKVDIQSGVAGFVFPGDRVDVILTYKTGPKQTDYESKTLLSKVLVLAVDQTATPDQGKQAMVSKTVTLEVLRQQAEELTQGQKLGVITLALHSAMPPLQSLDNIDVETTTFSAPITKKPPTSTINLLRGEDDKTIQFDN